VLGTHNTKEEAEAQEAAIEANKHQRIIGHMPDGSVLCQRTAHGADGKFTSGSGGSSHLHGGILVGSISPVKAAYHARESVKHTNAAAGAEKTFEHSRKHAHEKSALAHKASEKAYQTGHPADHKAANAAHQSAAAAHIKAKHGETAHYTHEHTTHSAEHSRHK